MDLHSRLLFVESGVHADRAASCGRVSLHGHDRGAAELLGNVPRSDQDASFFYPREERITLRGAFCVRTVSERISLKSHAKAYQKPLLIGFTAGRPGTRERLLQHLERGAGSDWRSFSEPQKIGGRAKIRLVFRCIVIHAVVSKIVKNAPRRMRSGCIGVILASKGMSLNYQN